MIVIAYNVCSVCCYCTINKFIVITISLYQIKMVIRSYKLYELSIYNI